MNKLPAIRIEDSVTDYYIVCLEDGMRVHSLRAHLKLHYNMTVDEYLERWSLPDDYPVQVMFQVKKNKDGSIHDDKGRWEKSQTDTIPGLIDGYTVSLGKVIAASMVSYSQLAGQSIEDVRHMMQNDKRQYDDLDLAERIAFDAMEAAFEKIMEELDRTVATIQLELEIVQKLVSRSASRQ